VRGDWLPGSLFLSRVPPHSIPYLSAVVPASGSVGTRSSPIQNFGGIGRSSRSSFALVDGEVNGSGTCPPRSAVEQETVKNPATIIKCMYRK